MCCLKLIIYGKAQAAFARAIEGNFDNSETLIYVAVSILNGKKAFLAKLADIGIEEYIQAALMIVPNGIYYYFEAYIIYNHFNRKS